MINPNDFYVYITTDHILGPEHVKVGATRDIVQTAISAWEATPNDSTKFRTLIAIEDPQGHDPNELARGIVSDLRATYAGTDDSELIAGRIGSWLDAEVDDVEGRLRGLLEARGAILEDVDVGELIAMRDRFIHALRL